MSARTTALRALIACRTAGAWSDAILRDYMKDLDAREAALCTTLCCGVLQNRMLLDYYIDSFLQGRKRLPPALRDIMRLAVYQMLFLDRIPDSAAVNEAVKQTGEMFGKRERGLCNAVLRSISRNRSSLTPPKDYSIRYSHPAELVDLMKASVGKKLQPILEANNTPAETVVHWNPLRCSETELLTAWESEGITYEQHPWLSGCWLLTGTGNVEKLTTFQNGWFQIQDAAARLSVQVLDLQPGMRILDLCAAPGGKTVAAGMFMRNQGSIYACDIHAGKLPQITALATRLGISIIEAVAQDSRIYRPEWDGLFDAVIADVPCSGLGVIRKKPEIRYRDIQTMEQLPVLQQEILETAGSYVRPGGQLLYSTCTILRRENEDVVEAFLSLHPEFSVEPVLLPEGLETQRPGMLTLYQGIDHCDGFFLCSMRKRL